MKEEETVFTAHIGETDVFEWTQGVGKVILMPILLKVCEEVIEDKLEEKIAARIEFSLRGTPKAYDFLINYEGIDDTLDKIMEWALSEEYYEMCSKVKKLKERLQNEDISNWG